MIAATDRHLLWKPQAPVMCVIKLKEVHCLVAGLVPARTAGGRGPQGGHKGRPYEATVVAAPSI